MSALPGYDHWLTTTPEDEADAAALRQSRREAAAAARMDAEPYYASEQTFPCLRWNPAARRAEAGTFTAHPDDFVYDPMRGEA